MGTSRIIVRVGIDPERKARLARTAKRFGMTSLTMVDRLAALFASQPPDVQAATLSRRDADAGRLAMEKLARLPYRRASGL